MRMNKIIKKRIILAFIILIYNIIGLFTVCSIMGSDLYSGDWTIWMSLLTFPIIIISFVYRYMQPNTLYPVFIIQFFILLLTLYLGNYITKKYFSK
ncbi:hypothetical protein FACS1894169_12760 [Bacteroidia bacterium]|nr:hypothetical protein FACS1894169_12760 [Bacteroidia bacterium]